MSLQALTGAALVVLSSVSLAPPTVAKEGEGFARNAHEVPSRYLETGLASWYGAAHQGRRTASGEIFDRNGVTAAHRTLPLGSLVRVTSLANGRSVVVRINDRGPYKNKRAIDLSERAAERIGLKKAGVSKVRIEAAGAAARTARAAIPEP